jgi:ABC-type lipoprotein export system ATPase subunit
MDYGRKFAKEERPDRAMHLLELVGMADEAHQLPPLLSGGQQQRIAIARALANDPPMLTADEPTGNLDTKTADAIFDLFAGLIDSGKTILMVTHDNDLARRAQETVELADGEVVDRRIN